MSAFIQQSVERAVEFRRVQASFHSRGQAALESYGRTGRSHAAADVIAGLQAKLERKRKTVGSPFEVRLTDAAREDLERLFDFLLDRANSIEDFEVAQRAIEAIQDVVLVHLARTPYSFRKAGSSSLRRELIIPFGSSGDVALFEIEPATERVIVLAVRHQLEDDYL